MWSARKHKIHVGSMANAHVAAARDYLKRRIVNDEWIFTVEMNTPHARTVALALKSIRRLERWRAWVDRFDYELQRREGKHAESAVSR